jgi:molybdate transport system ATP-binding protein
MTWSVRVRARVGDLELDVELEGNARPVALVGPNGSGKTTLLRIVAGALRPDRGTVSLDGRTLFDSAAGVDLPIERRRVAYLPQGYGLFPHLRVVDNVAFGLAHGERPMGRDERRRVALAMLAELGVDGLASRFPRRLSGGEGQRVALARALVVDPRILLLDEPMAALDTAQRRKVRAFLASWLASQGRPAIVATHDVRDVVALGATVCGLDGGRVVQRGSVAELRAAPATEFLAEFVGADLQDGVP